MIILPSFSVTSPVTSTVCEMCGMIFAFFSAASPPPSSHTFPSSVSSAIGRPACPHLMRKLFLVFSVVAASAVLRGQTPPTASRKIAPNVDQILSLTRAGSPEISPDGRLVAYTVRETNWDDNAYETEIWLADTRA